MCIRDSIRHASAGTRGSLGNHTDLDRPLDPVGLDQAAAIASRFHDADLGSIFTSVATRCVQTVEPLGEMAGLDVVEHPALTEGQSCAGALHLVRTLAQDGTNAVLCSHGDIIPDLIQTLAREGMVIRGPRGWAKGSTWELRTRGTDITEAEFLGPF